MPEIELHLAFVWDCDACGRENFVRAFTAPLSREQKHETALAFGMITPEQSADHIPDSTFKARPAVVACPHCEAHFTAIEAKGT